MFVAVDASTVLIIRKGKKRKKKKFSCFLFRVHIGRYRDRSEDLGCYFSQVPEMHVLRA